MGKDEEILGDQIAWVKRQFDPLVHSKCPVLEMLDELLLKINRFFRVSHFSKENHFDEPIVIRCPSVI